MTKCEVSVQRQAPEFQFLYFFAASFGATCLNVLSSSLTNYKTMILTPVGCASERINLDQTYKFIDFETINIIWYCYNNKYYYKKITCFIIFHLMNYFIVTFNLLSLVYYQYGDDIQIPWFSRTLDQIFPRWGKISFLDEVFLNSFPYIKGELCGPLALSHFFYVCISNCLEKFPDMFNLTTIIKGLIQ